MWSVDIENMLWSDIFLNFLGTAVLVMLLYFKNYFRAVYLAFKIPGPTALPILGNVLLLQDHEKLEILGTRISELYGPLVRVWLSVIPFFIITEPDHIQRVLRTGKYSTKNMFYTLLHNFIGNGLITSTGKKWKQHRKLIQPCFHLSILKVYFDAFYKFSKAMVEELSQEVDVDITKYSNKFVLHVLQDTVLGFSSHFVADNSPFRQGKLIMPHRLVKPWLLIDVFFKRTKLSKIEFEQRNNLKNYTRKVFEKRKNCNNSFLNNLMDIMIVLSKENPEFTEEDIIDEACTFMLAGQDSVGAALAFSLYFLATHQDVQDKVIKEQHNLFQSLNCPVTFEKVGEMKYLEQCIKEAMRLCPSVPMIARKVITDLPLGKNIVPAGSNILISPFVTHRLPHIFSNPLNFDPDRFSEKNKLNIHPFGYIPFSAGPRNCIGYKFALIELKTAISEILRNYHVSLTPGYEKLNLSYRITLRARKGIWLRLKRRHQ